MRCVILSKERMMAAVCIVTGRVVAVQEERLRLLANSGQALLLTLGKNAWLAADLGDLLHTQAPVRVAYTGEANLVSGIVHRIEII